MSLWGYVIDWNRVSTPVFGEASFLLDDVYPVHYATMVGQWLKSMGLVQGSAAPSGAVLHSSSEQGVRRPCSEFMDMLRRLINCRIIIIIIIITLDLWVLLVLAKFLKYT